MYSVVIRETNDGWVMKLDFSFSKEVKLDTLDEAGKLADKFRLYVYQFDTYSVPTKPEEKKE